MKQEEDFRPQTYCQRQPSFVDHVDSDLDSEVVAVVFTSNCCQYGSYCCYANCAMMKFGEAHDFSCGLAATYYSLDFAN